MGLNKQLYWPLLRPTLFFAFLLFIFLDLYFHPILSHAAKTQVQCFFFPLSFKMFISLFVKPTPLIIMLKFLVEEKVIPLFLFKIMKLLAYL